jgi:AraC-like DNA-binding protein
LPNLHRPYYNRCMNKAIIRRTDYTLPYPFTITSGEGVCNAFPRHIHQSVTFGLVVAGEREIIAGLEKSTAGPNDLFVIDSYIPHQCRVGLTAPCHYFILNIPKGRLTTLLTSCGESLPEAWGIGIQIINDPVLAAQFQSFCTHCLDDEGSEVPPDPIAVQKVLTSFARYCRPFKAHPQAIDPRIITAYEYIQNHFQAQFTLGDLAAQAGMTAFHFNRLFAKSYGIPPHALLLQLRTKKAQELMFSDYTDPCGVGLELGFYDQSHFIRNFKKHVGTTPLHFFRARRGKK